MVEQISTGLIIYTFIYAMLAIITFILKKKKLHELNNSITIIIISALWSIIYMTGRETYTEIILYTFLTIGIYILLLLMKWGLSVFYKRKLAF